jgi:hypothetical protein
MCIRVLRGRSDFSTRDVSLEFVQSIFPSTSTSYQQAICSLLSVCCISVMRDPKAHFMDEKFMEQDRSESSHSGDDKQLQGLPSSRQNNGQRRSTSWILLILFVVIVLMVISSLVLFSLLKVEKGKLLLKVSSPGHCEPAPGGESLHFFFSFFSPPRISSV